MDSITSNVELTNLGHGNQFFLKVTVSDLHILSTVLHHKRYGLEILNELEGQGLKVSLGSIYSFLRRLEKNELIIAEWGEPTKERGGHRRKYFRITDSGERLLKDVKTRLVPLLQFST